MDSAFIFSFSISFLSGHVSFGDVRERKTGVITYFVELDPIGYLGGRVVRGRSAGQYLHTLVSLQIV